MEPYEMATLYWSRLKGRAIFEVSHLITKLKSPKGKEYWNEVLLHLNVRKNGKGDLQ